MLAVPLSPSVIELSAIDSVGSTGGGGGGVDVSGTPFSVKAEAPEPVDPGVAWKPKVAWPLAATLAFQSALLTT